MFIQRVRFTFASSESQSQEFNFPGDIKSMENVDMGVSAIEERKKKLAKRLMDITNKMESLSNQIYHLEQRIELLERKAGVRIE